VVIPLVLNCLAQTWFSLSFGAENMSCSEVFHSLSIHESCLEKMRKDLFAKEKTQIPIFYLLHILFSPGKDKRKESVFFVNFSVFAQIINQLFS